MNHRFHSHALRLGTAAGLLLGAAVAASAANSSIVTFSVDMTTQIQNNTFTNGMQHVWARGTFNNYSTGANADGSGSSQLTNNPAALNPNIYSGTFNDTNDANGTILQYKYYTDASIGSGWEDDIQNRERGLPVASGGAVALPIVYFDDKAPTGLTPVTNTITFNVDMSQQITLGNFVPGSDQVYAVGGFEGWAVFGPMMLTNNPAATNTNVYSGTWFGPLGTDGQIDNPNAPEFFKYYNSHTGTGYENVSPQNTDNSSNAGNGNRVYNLLDTNGAIALPVVYFNDAPPAPPTTNTVTFQVDMSALYGGLFDPNQDIVTLAGNFNSWSTASTICTNDPNAANPNIYSTVITFVAGQGTTEQYKFIYSGGNVPGGLSWENPQPPTIGGNRFFNQLGVNTNIVLPAVYFSDVPPNSVVPTNTSVTFTVNMTGAKSFTSGTAFNPSTDQVYVNADFLGWAGNKWDTQSVAPYVLTNSPVGSSNYTITLPVLKGNPLSLTYKYGFYSAIDANNNSVDNEAGFGINHYRYVRQSPAYTLPTDVFGNQFGESVKFGNLKATDPVLSPHVTISWSGLPGVHLQTRSTVTGGAWTDLWNTDGTNWTAGYTTFTNGFVSVTNYPTTAGSTFFRLVQPGK